MPESKKPARPWQEIASDAAQETNTRRLIELSTELCDALDQQDRNWQATNVEHPNLPRFRHGDHICFSYHSEPYLIEFLSQFVVQGLLANERCFCVQKPSIVPLLLRDLEARGIDTEEEQKRGALELHSEEEIYFPSGKFQAGVIISLLVQSLDESLEKGFSGLRTAGELSWAMGNPAIYETLIGYERMVNQCCPGRAVVSLCQYPANDLPRDAFEAILQHHSIHLAQGNPHDA